MSVAFSWAAAAALLLASPASAQSFGPVIPAPADPAAIPLDTGGVAGSMAPESWFRNAGMATVRNVQTATLTPVLPARGTATGAAVIVAPGGGFVMFSMDNEGWPVAHWLARHGIAAFVLKYRLTPTPADMPGFMKSLGAGMSRAIKADGTASLPAPPEAVADARAAIALVRARAKQWDVDPRRVGMVGFSAGAMTTLALTMSSTPDDMPAFIAPIYGPMAAIAVPAAAPPMFNVLANDDPLFARKGLGLIEAWQAARRPVEFHLYQAGGHGFGMGRAGTTSPSWIEAFRSWLDANGFLKTKP